MATLHAAPFAFPLPTLAGAVGTARVSSSISVAAVPGLVAVQDIPHDLDADSKKWLRALHTARAKLDAQGFDEIFSTQAKNVALSDPRVLAFLHRLILTPFPTAPAAFRPVASLLHLARTQRVSLRHTIAGSPNGSAWEAILAWNDVVVVDAVVRAGGFADGTEDEVARGVAWVVESEGQDGDNGGFGMKEGVLRSLFGVPVNPAAFARGLRRHVPPSTVPALLEYLVRSLSLDQSTLKSSKSLSPSSAALAFSCLLDAHPAAVLMDPSARSLLASAQKIVHAWCDDFKRTDTRLRGVLVPYADRKGKEKGGKSKVGSDGKESKENKKPYGRLERMVQQARAVEGSYALEVLKL
ncbi:hypothetical protein HDU93_007589 [Gonapodya sp. JEL0774]|nr:hypothetical protein HDU93_007589 [Gonapodya sp. JEL0774]